MKPFDLSKFRKSVNKSLKITDGYHDPKIWVHTGNYALNKMISGSFHKGIPLGKVTVFAGESGSGKSYVCCGNLVRECIEQDILPVILDSEFAIDEAWLEALGVDPNKVVRFPVSLVDDCAALIDTFMKQYEEDFANVPPDERQKVLFIIDSFGMLTTPTAVDQFGSSKGMRGDMGHKPKQLKALITRCLSLFGPHNIGLVATNHTYASQDVFSPDPVVSGGSGPIFAASIVVGLSKFKLKEDADGNKVSEVLGIRSKMKVIKSRFSRPFTEVSINIPYSEGMNPYSGLFDLFESKGALVKDGNRYRYTCRDGTEFKLYRKDFGPEQYDRMMVELEEQEDGVASGVGLELDGSSENE